MTSLVTASSDRVRFLVTAAERWLHILRNRYHAIQDSDTALVVRVRDLLAVAENQERVTLDNADLDRIHQLAEDFKRIDPDPLTRLLHIHVIACYLFVPLLILGGMGHWSIIIAPLSVPVLLLTYSGGIAFGRSLEIGITWD